MKNEEAEGTSENRKGMVQMLREVILSRKTINYSYKELLHWFFGCAFLCRKKHLKRLKAYRKHAHFRVGYK